MYLNQLVKKFLVATHFRGRDRPMNLKELAAFGNTKLFEPDSFTFQISLDDVKEARKKGMSLDYERPWRCYEGSFLSYDAGIVTVADKESGENRYFATDQTTVVQEQISDGEKVCVYALLEENHYPLAKVIVDEGVNDMVANHFQHTSVKANSVKEYLLLTEAEKWVLTGFLTNDDYRMKIITALGYLASSVMSGIHLEDDKDIRKWLKKYNEGCKLQEKVLPEEVITLLNTQDVKYVLRGDRDDKRNAPPWLVFLTMSAILFGKTIWSDETAKASVLLKHWNYRYIFYLAASLAQLCPSEEVMDEMVKGVINEIQQKTPLRERAEQLLLELLLVDTDIKMGDDTLHCILDELFGDSINSLQLACIPKMKKGELINRIRPYIMKRFQESFDIGKPEFVHLWCALWANDQIELGNNPLELSETYILNEPGKQSALVGLVTLSQTAWSRRIGGGAPLREFAMKRQSVEMEQAISGYLSCNDSRFYQYAVSCLEDLVLNDLISNRFLASNKQVAEACRINLTAEDSNREYAETLLALYPGEFPLEISKCQREEYKRRLEAAFQDDNADDVMKYFRICQNTGVFENRETTFLWFSKAVEYCSKKELDFNLSYKEALHPDMYPYFRMCREELLLLYKNKLTKTPTSAVKVLAKSDNLDAVFRAYARIAEKLRDNSNGVFRMRHAWEVAEFIAASRFVEQNLSRCGKEAKLLRELVPKVKIEASIGSLLVMNWFLVLVRFDMGAEAVSFCRRYKRILNRPYQFYSTREHHPGELKFDFSDYNRFLHGKTRLMESLDFAADIGAQNTVETFKEAAKTGAFSQEIADEISGLPEVLQARDAFDKNVRVTGRINSDFPGFWGIQGFHRYYDDLGIVKWVPRGEAIYQFGYKHIL